MAQDWQQHGVMLHGVEARALLRQCSRAGPTDVQSQWLPKNEEIARVSALLFGYQARLRALDRYRSVTFNRQYAGFVANGRKIIYVNSFRAGSAEPWWRKRAVVICDGGAQHWGVEFDMKTGRFTNAAFNGQ